MRLATKFTLLASLALLPPIAAGVYLAVLQVRNVEMAQTVISDSTRVGSLGMQVSFHTLQTRRCEKDFLLSIEHPDKLENAALEWAIAAARLRDVLAEANQHSSLFAEKAGAHMHAVDEYISRFLELHTRIVCGDKLSISQAFDFIEPAKAQLKDLTVFAEEAASTAGSGAVEQAAALVAKAKADNRLGFQLFAAAAVWGASVLIFTAWLLSRRLQHLRRATERLAGGNYDRPMLLPGSDEIAGLAGCMDEMRRSILNRDRELSDLARIVRRTDNGVLLMDRNGHITWCNESFQRCTGWTLDEIRGKRPRDFLHGPASSSATMDRMLDAFVQQRPFREEIQNYRRNGELFWELIDFQPTYDDAGQLTGFMSVQSDITQLKALQRANDQQRERLRIATTALNAGVWDYFPDSGELLWSPAMFGIFGVDTAVTPTYDLWRSMLHHDDKSAAEQLFERTQRMGMEFHTTFRINRKGEVRHIQADAVVVRDDAGRVQRVVGINIDVTERILAESLRREIDERLQKIAAQLPGVVYQFRLYPDGRLCFPYASEGIRQIYRVSPEEVRLDASPVFAILHPDDLSRVSQSIADSAATLQPWRCEYRVKHHDGTIRWLLGNSVPERQDDGSTIWHGYIADFTEHVAQREQLKDAQLAAEAASRAKSEFLANMSHEIRTPMTAILGYADLLGGTTEQLSAATRQETVDIIRRNGEHLLSLINDILDLSKIEAGRMTVENLEVDLLAVLADVNESLGRKAAAKGLTLTCSANTEIPARIICDPLRLRQILINLVSNAVKFTHDGRVDITLSVQATGGAPILRFEVIDTGIGISPDQLPRLFNAFHQADTSTTRLFGGTGLGLRICKKLAEILGGDLRVESAEGKGSTFTLTLPVNTPHNSTLIPAQLLFSTADRNTTTAAEPVANERTSETSSPAQPLAGRSILIVDDGIDNQRLFKHILSAAGATITLASNGKEALDHLATNAADLILLDMQMPVMDGYTAARRLRGLGNTTPILALTAHAMCGERTKCIDAGCDDYATKPIDRKKLVENCLRVMQVAATHATSTQA